MKFVDSIYDNGKIEVTSHTRKSNFIDLNYALDSIIFQTRAIESK